MITTLDLSGIQAYVSEEEIRLAVQSKALSLESILRGEFGSPADMGWFSPSRWEADEALLDQILAIAREARTDGDVFVLVGVGGSNRGAQSVIQALGDRQVEILYAGDNLSSQALKKVLAKIQGRSVYLNVIAKDFNTLEPGIAFRLLRQHLESVYGDAAKERIILTGSQGKEQLYELSQRQGYTYLPFPADTGGRFSVLSPVGLLPIAVAGVDIRQLIQGAIAVERELKSLPLMDNPAVRYAAARNLLFVKGFLVENLVILEPDLTGFARWWGQLFAESEGKNQHCIFPTWSMYSEDLHAVGQYIQEGKRMIMETFIDARFSNPDITIQPSQIEDGFGYIDHQQFDVLSEAVYQAAFSAHSQSGVPCLQFKCGEIEPHVFGELFYLFMLSVCFSASWINVDPFGQPGVEAYKRFLYRALGKTRKEPTT